MELILSSLILYYSNAPFIVLLCDAATYMELISFGLKLRCHDSSIIIFLRDVAKMSKISLVILSCSDITIIFSLCNTEKMEPIYVAWSHTAVPRPEFSFFVLQKNEFYICFLIACVCRSLLACTRILEKKERFVDM